MECETGMFRQEFGGLYGTGEYGGPKECDREKDCKRQTKRWTYSGRMGEWVESQLNRKTFREVLRNGSERHTGRSRDSLGGGETPSAEGSSVPDVDK